MTPRASLFHLLGCAGAAGVDPTQLWTNPNPEVPVGVTAEGDSVTLDLAPGGEHAGYVFADGYEVDRHELLRTTVLGLALGRPPGDLELWLVNVGDPEVVRDLAQLPHVSSVKYANGSQWVVDTLQAELSAEVDTRRRRLQLAGYDAGAGGLEAYLAARRGGADLEPLAALVVAVNDPEGRLAALPEFEEILELFRTDRWTGVRLLLATQEPPAKQLGPVLALDASGDPHRRGWADVHDGEGYGQPVHLAYVSHPYHSPAPRPHVAHDPAVSHVVDQLAAATLRRTDTDPAVREAVGAFRPTAGGLPVLVPAGKLPKPGDDPACGIPLGRAATLGLSLAKPVYLDFDVVPHLLVTGDAGCGKTNVLRLVSRAISERYALDDSRILIIDYRRHLQGVVSSDHLIGYAADPTTAATLVSDVCSSLKRRLPGPQVDAAQLAERGWWRGPELFVLVDGYELVAGVDPDRSGRGDHNDWTDRPERAEDPLQQLVRFLPHADQVGLHLLLSTHSRSMAAARTTPLLRRLAESGPSTLAMTGAWSAGEPLAGIPTRSLPPGRAVLTGPDGLHTLVQTAWSEP